MDEHAKGDLNVKLVRYDVTRWQIAQTSVPIAALAAVAARHFANAITMTAAFAVQVLAVVLFIRARHSYGHQTLLASSGSLKFVDSGEKLHGASVSRWTIRGATARLYGSARSFKVSADPHDAEALRAALSTVLGQQTALIRRGSPRAIKTALGVCIGGIAVFALALHYQILPLFLVGLLCALGGLIALGVLSQRVGKL